MRKTLIAQEGFIYTNGSSYGESVDLAVGSDGSEFYLITEEEYKAIFEPIHEEQTTKTEASYRMVAKPGYWLTNGRGLYVQEVPKDDTDKWYEIADEEYQKTQEETLRALEQEVRNG